jgi:hypothetical protein
MERLANFGSFVITSISLRLALEKLTLLLSRDIFSLFLDKATVITVTIKRRLNSIVSTADTQSWTRIILDYSLILIISKMDLQDSVGRYDPPSLVKISSRFLAANMCLLNVPANVSSRRTQGSESIGRFKSRLFRMSCRKLADKRSSIEERRVIRKNKLITVIFI